MDTITNDDRQFAKDVGVSLADDTRGSSMDDLHRHHIERLKETHVRQIAHFTAEGVRHLGQKDRLLRGLRRQKDRVHVWQLVAFAGWFVSGLFILRDLIGSGR